MTKLNAVAWVVRLAVRLGMPSVTVCSDSEVALAQVLSLRACSHVQHQQAIVRSLARVFWTLGLVVRLVWVPSALQPGDPMSRVSSDFAKSQARAEVQAWEFWERMLCHLDPCKIRGVLARPMITGLGGGGGRRGFLRANCHVGVPWPA